MPPGTNVTEALFGDIRAQNTADRTRLAQIEQEKQTATGSALLRLANEAKTLTAAIDARNNSSRANQARSLQAAINRGHDPKLPADVKCKVTSTSKDTHK